MTSTITDVRAKLYTWKGDVQKIHENFCTNAADLINQDNISNDRWATYKFLSWLVVEVETSDGLSVLVMPPYHQSHANQLLIII